MFGYFIHMKSHLTLIMFQTYFMLPYAGAGPIVRCAVPSLAVVRLMLLSGHRHKQYLGYPLLAFVVDVVVCSSR